MKLPGTALLVSTFCLLISCGGGSTGGTGGSGGSGGSGGANAGSSGGGASGTAGNNGSTGTAGATGSGGGTGTCPACVSCVTASCASAVSSCTANAGCNTIYQCAKGCTTSIQTCVQNNIAAAQTFYNSVYACITSSCSTQCNY